MVSVLALSAVDRAFESRVGLTKEYKIYIAAFPLSTKHSGVRANVYRWTRNQYNVSDWSNLSTVEEVVSEPALLKSN
jgi:hypothetical protein